jgi:glycerol-3-phosphate acyltransferase PlsY
LGHSFTPYLRFRGGKGVATTAGVLLALEPVATAIALAAFFLVFGITRIVAAGSLAFAAVLPLAVFVRGDAPLAVGLLTIVLALLIIGRHQSNIRRMLAGEET